jgi:glucose/arabinose dehydrogenase
MALLKTTSRIFILFYSFLLIGCSNSSGKYTETEGQKLYPSELELELKLVAENLNSPVGMTHAGDGSGRLFIISQRGQILILKDGRVQEEPFLDIRDRMAKLPKGYTEMGLLGLAFHPAYKENGRFFIYYSASSEKEESDHRSIIAEYHVSQNDPNKAAKEERVLLTVEQPEPNHNGGQMAFGPDGFLYVGLGDGGGAGDQHGDIGNGQNVNNLLGSIIRLDTDSEEAYEVPRDNPFVDKPYGKKEIYAYGLRNPWRFSFDRKTGKLFCADVGQNKYEEINIIEKGKNYGWRAMEGMHIYDEKLYGQGTSGEYIMPVSEYPHEEGISVTGGYVYRGDQFKDMQGKYFFADWSGKLFYLEQLTDLQWSRHKAVLKGKDTHETDFRINSFGEAEDGELYIVGQRKKGGNDVNGVVYRLLLAVDKNS